MKKILIAVLAAAALCACAPKIPGSPYTTKLEKVRKCLSKSGDKFVYFCDSHTEKAETCVTPATIEEILSTLPVGKVIFGGDFCMTLNGCADKDDLDRSVELFTENVNVTKAAGADFYCVRGNHDMTTGTINPDDPGYTYSEAHVHETIMSFSEGSPYVGRDSLTCNYYFDNEAARLRYIVLDPYSSPEEDVVERYAIRMEYAGAANDWCRDCLETLPEGWKAVVLLHQGLNKSTGCCDFRNMRGVLALVSEKSDKVALVLHGHTHKDAETFEHGVLHVSTTSSLYKESKGTIFGAVSRCINTPDETALDVVDMDLAHGKINMWRIGYGYDRLINTAPKTVRAGESLKLKPSLKHVDSWKIYDADGLIVNSWVGWETDAVLENKYATLEGNSLKALAPGEVVVVATDETAGSREYFYVTVVVSE